MLGYVLRRVPSAIAVLLVSSVVIFALLRLVPGDPATTIAGANASPRTVAAVRRELGLTGSPVSQYLSWMGGLLTFRLGRSLSLGGQISTLVGQALGNTLVLAVAALLLAIVIALALSLASAITGRRWIGSVVALFSTLAVAIPSFVTGVVLVMILGVIWVVLPAGGMPRAGIWADPSITVQYLAMPAVTLALPIAAALTRFLSESLRTQLAEPYLVTARALGISRRRIAVTQALPNALPPTFTVLGLLIGQLLGGAVIVESIFAWPGLGNLLSSAISARDYPVVQVLLVFSVAVFTVIQLLTDLVNAWLDPRIRLGGLP
jgi:peptide/nickel transport system permease protein